MTTRAMPWAACNDTIGAVADVILTAIGEGRLGVTLPAE